MAKQDPAFPADEYLSADEVRQLHEVLQAQISELLEDTREELHHMTSDREVDADTLDMAVNESNRDFALRLADRERRLLKKLRHAMHRIQQGEYGTCESCGAPITFARLMARPVATLCIDCKTEAEQLERPRRMFV